MKPYYEDGSVTIYHGDCRGFLYDAAQGGMDAVMVTDPPYGMALKSGRGGAFGPSTIEGDVDTALRDEALAIWGHLPALVMGRWSVPRPAGTRMVLTWEKGEHVGMGDLSLPWKPNTEEIYVLGSGFAGHRGSSVIRVLAIAGTVGQAGKGTRLHPTQKPVALFRKLLEKCPQSLILDPFMGSGTTLVAAAQLGRRAVGIETEERYCEIAARRFDQAMLDFGDESLGTATLGEAAA